MKMVDNYVLKITRTWPGRQHVEEQDYFDAAKKLGVTIVDEEIKPGDMYLAGRNVGIQLLTCHKVTDNYIVPKEKAYPYDVWECKKIQIND